MIGEQMFDRSWRIVQGLWRDWAGGGSAVDRSLGPEALVHLRRRMVECLEARGGEASARARAAELGRHYLSLDVDGRRRFLLLLADGFGLDEEAAKAAAQRFAAGEIDAATLREALAPPRVRLLTQFTALPQGVKVLVDLRAAILGLLDQKDPESAVLKGLDADLKALLTAWFDVGLLELQRITWDSPASLLETLFVTEAVHKIKDWKDLRDRLDSDRRVYAFFHPRMAQEPLIVLNVALTKGIANSVQQLLDEGKPSDDPAAADTAMFYSISNAQPGLRGIGFGNFLIKQVVDLLRREFPRVTTFATLSPMPGFRRWVDQLPTEDATRLADPKHPVDPRPELSALTGPPPAEAGRLAHALARLGAAYLVQAKRDQLPLDPVARFHLGNGAAIERINVGGDRSEKGWRESYGVMVNYLYRLETIEANHEALEAHGTVVASDAVRALLDTPRRFSLFRSAG